MRGPILVVASAASPLFAIFPSAFAGDVPIQPYGLDFHITPPNYAGCAAGADVTATCANRNPNGVTATGAMWVWIFASGVSDGTKGTAADGIGSIAFGLEYDAGVGPAIWSACHAGTESPQNDKGGTWPESGTGLAVTWPDDCYRVTENDDGLTAIGILTIDPAATGFIDFIEDPRPGAVSATDCSGATFAVCPERRGRAEVTAGGTGGVLGCDETCTQSPVDRRTWSAIKAVYGRP
jgi:hypothetical protein